MDQFNLTTGKNYKSNTRKCKSCQRIFALTKSQVEKVDAVRCPYCGSSDLTPFQRTTAKLPTKD